MGKNNQAAPAAYKPGNVRSEMTVVTPEVAAAWLAKNTRNRPLNEPHVRKLMAELVADRWVYNDDSIKFGADGVLLDGQHRLTACSRSGKSLVTRVTHGLSPDVFSTLGSVVKPRSPSDILALAGYPNAISLASTINWVARYHAGYHTGENSWRPLAPAQHLEVLAEHPGVVGSTALYVKHSRPVRKHVRSFVAAAHYLFSAVDEQAADAWLVDLCDGAGLAPDDPVWRLRERLINGEALRPEHTFAMFIKAWNQRRRGIRVPGLFRAIISGGRQDSMAVSIDGNPPVALALAAE